MHRYGSSTKVIAACTVSMVIGACSLPSSRENVEAASSLVATQTSAPLLWRRDSDTEQLARSRIEAMLPDGLTLEEAVSVAFLANPELQIALEQLEMSRAQLVAAATPPNPVAIIGIREPGGNLSAFYPGRNVTVGALQNVVALMNLPQRRSVASRDLDRARFEAANRIVQFGARVAQAWLEYCAAMRIQELRSRSLSVVQMAFQNLQGSPIAQQPDTGFQLLIAQQRAQVFNYSNAVERAGIDVAAAREKLALLLGLAGWHDEWRISGSLPALPVEDLDAAAMEQSALEKRLDVQAAASAVDARLKLLAMQRRFRWLNQMDIGLFREKAIGGTAFTGPNAVVEIPLFDQRQAQLLNSSAELRAAMRTLETLRAGARADIRTRAAEMDSTRRLIEQYEKQTVPNQQQILLLMGSSSDPNQSDRLRFRLTMLGDEEQQVGWLRDYWRARSALAVSLGNWPSASLVQ